MRSLINITVLVLAFGIFLVRSHPDSWVRAGTAVRMGVDELVENADLVFEGEVASSASLLDEGLVETEYLIRVDRTFWGQDLPTRVVRLPGGVLADGSGLLLAGMPHVEVGERVLLFLTEANAREVRMPVGLAQGKLRVVPSADGGKAVVGDLGGLQLLSPATGVPAMTTSATVRDYAEVVAEIHRAVARKRSR